SEKENKKASLGSIFLRYILQEENAEIYGEYGRNDRYASPINLITDKNYPGGYIVGFRKLSNMSSNGSRFEFSTEIA
ncbi:hypothetical protein ACE4Z7_25400, partial [Salmonella enterica]|uniref:hypothetical protein n=1 Tax=Salmonella enterica TaxID=28901 RepID=UPI003D2DE264